MARRERHPSDRSAAAVAVLALAPLVSLALPFRTGLWAQGIAILAVLLARLAPRLSTLAATFAAAPFPLRLGLSLYTGATLWGAAVGVAAGHPLPAVVGQVASMLLLPAGFAAFAVAPRPTPPGLVGGLTAALGAALALHLAAFLGLAAVAPPPGEAVRLVFRNDIGYGSVAVVVAVLALGWLCGGGGIPALAALAVATVAVVGAMSRGGWAATLVGIAVALALTWSGRRRSPLALLALAAPPLAALAAVLAIGARAGEPIAVVAGGRPVQPNAADGAPAGDLALSPESGPLVLERSLPAATRGIEVAAAATGEAGGEAVLTVTPHSGGTPVSGIVIPFTGGAGERKSRLVRLPPGATGVRLEFRITSGAWRVETLTLRRLPGGASVWMRAVSRRLESLATAAAMPREDGTVGYRMREWHAVRAAWSQAGVGRLLAGHGLGAQFAFSNSSWDAAGNRVQVPLASYIHNWYVFLGFKLGLAGIAALAGVLALAGWSGARALALRSDARQGWPCAGATAVWVGLLVWSVSSPAILDFRLAPILGALVAVTAARAERPSAAPGA